MVIIHLWFKWQGRRSSRRTTATTLTLSHLFMPVPHEDMNKCFFLLIPVPPKLSPFTSDVTQHVGERASLTCSVTKGDLPLTITWLKDGRPLDPSQRVSITQVDQFNSILLIESLSPDHNGNYSCVARNLAAEVSRTQQLVVNGKQDSVSVPFFHSILFCLLSCFYSSSNSSSSSYNWAFFLPRRAFRGHAHSHGVWREPRRSPARHHMAQRWRHDFLSPGSERVGSWPLF